MSCHHLALFTSCHSWWVVIDQLTVFSPVDELSCRWISYQSVITAPKLLLRNFLGFLLYLLDLWIVILCLPCWYFGLNAMVLEGLAVGSKVPNFSGSMGNSLQSLPSIWKAVHLKNSSYIGNVSSQKLQLLHRHWLLMLWLVHKLLHYFQYYTGGAARTPILMAKREGWKCCLCLSQGSVTEGEGSVQLTSLY